MLYIENLNEEIKVDEDIIDTIQKMLEVVCENEGVEYEPSVDLTFMNDEMIHEVNKEQRDVDKPTDVLSFPLLSYEEHKVFSESYNEDNLTDDLFYEDRLMLGDVLISLNTAKRQAQEFGHSFKREVVFLFTHSLLHLLGYDHVEDSDRERMNEKEDKYMEMLGVSR